MGHPWFFAAGSMAAWVIVLFHTRGNLCRIDTSGVSDRTNAVFPIPFYTLGCFVSAIFNAAGHG